MSAPSPIELLSRVVPMSDEEAASVFGEAGREGLLDAITRLTPRGRPARRRLRRRSLVIALAAVVVVAAATGAGWALTHGSARDTTSIDCVIQGADTIIEATSGDPAADCAVAWQGLTGKPAPQLRAYDDGIGGVTVIPSSQKPPAGWTPIVSQNVALIELQESLDDSINGLNSACFGVSAATAFAQRQLDRLGLVGWTVQARSGFGPGESCANGVAEPEAKTISLMPVAGLNGRGALTNSLRPLTKECLSLPAMRSAVEQRATSVGMSQTAHDSRNYVLNSTEDDTMRCTTLYETVGGTIDLILRGPAHAGGG